MRAPVPGERVFVYRNLHRALFSVRALSGPDAGRVIAHLAEVSLRDAEFRVSEAGRQKVLTERRKNVHAGVAGCFAAERLVRTGGGRGISYDPYKAATFTLRGPNPVPLHRALRVTLDGRDNRAVGIH